MKILVLSDSHSGLSFMRYCIGKVRPEHVIHLGDFYEDATAMAQEYPHIRFHQVPGNCDSFASRTAPGYMCYPIGGVKLFMTHGHHHGVKSDTCRLVEAAYEAGAAAALFGHTHEPLCDRDENGLLVMNPGTCRSYSGTAGIIEVEDEKIVRCGITNYEKLESCDGQNE